jgi:hypothetical protein
VEVTQAPLADDGSAQLLWSKNTIRVNQEVSVKLGAAVNWLGRFFAIEYRPA